MNKLLPLLLPLISLLLLPSSVVLAVDHNLKKSDLQVGDIVLGSLPCYVCRLIEKETSSNFSHVGIVLKTGTETLVGESLSGVDHRPLDSFVERMRANSCIAVYRPLALAARQSQTQGAMLWDIYLNDFAGLPFDQDFLWDNTNEFGEEPLYCAEFVAKILSRFLGEERAPAARPMAYSSYYSDWERYFGGPPPEGQLGLSPASFARSEYLVKVGYLRGAQDGQLCLDK